MKFHSTTLPTSLHLDTDTQEVTLRSVQPGVGVRVVELRVLQVGQGMKKSQIWINCWTFSTTKRQTQEEKTVTRGEWKDLSLLRPHRPLRSTLSRINNTPPRTSPLVLFTNLILPSTAHNLPLTPPHHRLLRDRHEINPSSTRATIPILTLATRNRPSLTNALSPEQSQDDE